MVVQELDNSPSSRELCDRFTQTPYFDVRYQTTNPHDLDRLLETGRATLGLVIPPDFSRQLGQALPASVQLLLDGSNPNTALIALGYARRLIRTYARDIALRWVYRAGGAVGPVRRVQYQPRAWYNPDLRSVHVVVVSMLVLGVMLIAVLHPAAVLAWEKEAGTIEQLLVMPFRAWELMLAKIVPTFVISLASLALALWVPWWFEAPVRGSLPLFFALSALFLPSALGLGLLLGSLAENLQQALLLRVFALFSLFVISGTLVPVESMPRPMQYLSYVSPLRYYLDIGLGIFLKGVGIEILWPQAAAMAGLGILTLCLWCFRRQLR
jgi:ABC-2 type transport system permease protein